jgi:hypothetical protein
MPQTTIEIGPDGKVYLCEVNAWNSGLSPYQVDPIIRVYG